MYDTKHLANKFPAAFVLSGTHLETLATMVTGGTSSLDESTPSGYTVELDLSESTKYSLLFCPFISFCIYFIEKPNFLLLFTQLVVILILRKLFFFNVVFFSNKGNQGIGQ